MDRYFSSAIAIARPARDRDYLKVLKKVSKFRETRDVGQEFDQQTQAQHHAPHDREFSDIITTQSYSKHEGTRRFHFSLLLIPRLFGFSAS